MSYITTYTDLKDYFKGIVRNNKALNPGNASNPPSFYEFEDDFHGLKLKPTSFILLPCSYNLEDNNSDNIHIVNRIDFIIAKSGKKDNSDHNSAIFNDVFEILWDILTQIDTDMRVFPVTNRPFRDWNKNTVQIEEYGPFNQDYFIGYKVNFEIKNPRSLVRDGDKWYS